MSIDAEKQKIIDEASEHPYECACEKCKLWWESMPPEDEDEWCDNCQNLGTVSCHCGGDLCVCENNGEAPCPACDRGW